MVFSVGVVNGRFLFCVWVVNWTGFDQWRWIGVNCVGGVRSSVMLMKRLHAFAAEMFL